MLTASAALISVSPTSRPLTLSRANVRPYLPRIYGQSELSALGNVAAVHLSATLEGAVLELTVYIRPLPAPESKSISAADEVVCGRR